MKIKSQPPAAKTTEYYVTISLRPGDGPGKHAYLVGTHPRVTADTTGTAAEILGRHIGANMQYTSVMEDGSLGRYRADFPSGESLWVEFLADWAMTPALKRLINP